MTHHIDSSRERHFRVTGVTINSAGVDVASFTGLPAKYIVKRFTVYDTSTSLAVSIATLGLFTGAGATGTTVVTAALITSLTAATKYSDMTIAVTTDYLTSGSLFVNNVIAHGSAATVSIQLEIVELG